MFQEDGFQKIEGNAGKLLEGCGSHLKVETVRNCAVKDKIESKGLRTWSQIRGRENKTKDYAKVSSFIKVIF